MTEPPPFPREADNTTTTTQPQRTKTTVGYTPSHTDTS